MTDDNTGQTAAIPKTVQTEITAMPANVCEPAPLGLIGLAVAAQVVTLHVWRLAATRHAIADPQAISSASEDVTCHRSYLEPWLVSLSLR